MADISALGGLNPVETLDLSDGSYIDQKESTFQLPPKGRYTLQAPDNFPSTAFSRTQKGSLSAAIDPTIIGDKFNGFQIRYTKVSATTYERAGRKVSQLGDYLRACGFKGVLKSEQDQADAVEQTANKIFQADVDWRAYNSKTGFSLQGMEKFPKLADGTYQSWVEDPSDIDQETGKPRKVRANLVIQRFIPASV